MPSKRVLYTRDDQQQPVTLRVIAEDGDMFLGATPADIVRQMRNSEWGGPSRKGEYMLEVIERVQDMTGLQYAEDEFEEETGKPDPKNFLLFLRMAGLVRIKLAGTGMVSEPDNEPDANESLTGGELVDQT